MLNWPKFLSSFWLDRSLFTTAKFAGKLENLYNLNENMVFAYFMDM